MELRQQVESCFGFCPPYFEPAISQPLVLEGLWTHFRTSYLENPLPAIFKERLSALLARHSGSTYFMRSPSSCVGPLGCTLPKVVEGLDVAPITLDDFSIHENTLREQALPQWPPTNSPAERGILFCCLSIFLRHEMAPRQKLLRELLPQREYNCILLLLSYLQSCVQWADAHPDLLPCPDSLAYSYLERYLALNFDQGPIFDSLRDQMAWQTSAQSRLFTERYRLLSDSVESLSDGFMVVGPDLVIRYLNETARSLLGLPPDCRIGSHLDVLAPIGPGQSGLAPLSPEWTRFLSLVSRAPALNRAHQSELLLNGRRLLLHTHPNQDGSVVLLLSEVSSTVTGNQEMAPREVELAKALDISKVGFFEILVSQGRVRFSQQMRLDWGLPLEVESLSTEEAYRKVHPDDRELAKQIFEHCLTTLCPFSTEGRILRPDGSTVWLEIHGRVEADEAGLVQRFVGTCQDVTERKQVEELLRQSEEQFRSFVEWAPFFTFISDKQGQVLYNCPQFSEYIGQEGHNRRVPTWGLEFLHPDDLDATRKLWEVSLLATSSFEAEFRLRRHDGQFRWHRGRCLPIFDNQGSLEKWFGTFFDIHDQKQLVYEQELARESAEAASRAKTNFLANISHELRTPLTAIVGFCELLEANSQDLTTAARDQYQRAACRNSQQLLRIVDTLLDLSKIEADTLHLEPRVFSPRQELEEIQLSLCSVIQEKGLVFHSEISPDLPETIYGDPRRMRQILSHLLDNAIKFTESGTIKCYLNHDGSNLFIRMQDTGIGISPEVASQLFVAFEQADGSRSRKYGGSGLGLAFIRKLCRKLGGDFELEHSQPGKGSVFLASLPFGKCQTVTTQTSSNTQSTCLAGLKFLLAEDSPDVASLHQAMLELGGATVDWVENGQDCLERASQRPYSAVLMDIQMPVLDGMAATVQMRSQGMTLPIIALTAHSLQDERENCLKMGFDDYLTKPVALKSLFDCLLRHCSGSQANSQPACATTSVPAEG